MGVPKLRFKDFKGSWAKKRLSDVSIFLDGKRKPIKESDRSKMRGQYPYYGASGIIDYVNDYIFDAEIILLGEDGENIVSRNLPLAFKVTGKCWVNNHAHVIEPNQDTDIDFLTHALERTDYEIYNTGTAQPKLNQEVCRNIPLNFPSLPEQQKIASFLSAVDEKIQQLARKKELLEQYKKGVMQQLFSGKLRFKDKNGKTYPKWEQKRLDDLCDVRDGTHDSPKYYSTGKPLLTSKNLKENGTISLDEVNYISDEDFENINKRSGVSVGDILFGMIGTIGNPAIVKNTGFAIKNVALIKIGPKLLNTFLLQFFKSDLTLRQFHILNTGNTQKFVSLSTIRGLKVFLPVSEEQQKISSYLSVLDAKIESVAAQIAHTQTFKKGLLQQMFV